MGLPGSKSGCNPGKMGLPGLQPDLHARQNGFAGPATRFTRPAKWVCRASGKMGLPGLQSRSIYTHLHPSNIGTRCFTAPSLFVKIISTDTGPVAAGFAAVAGFGNGGGALPGALRLPAAATATARILLTAG